MMKNDESRILNSKLHQNINFKGISGIQCIKKMLTQKIQINRI